MEQQDKKTRRACLEANNIKGLIVVENLSVNIPIPQISGKDNDGLGIASLVEEQLCRLQEQLKVKRSSLRD